MELVIVLVGSAILLMISFYWIVKPLRSYDENLHESEEDRDEKEVVFSTLNEIEFDFRTKKISEEDYQNLKYDYEQEAMHLLRQQEIDMDDYEVNQELEAEIEQEIEREIELELEKELGKRSRSKHED